MYVNIVVPLWHKEEDVILIITEVQYDKEEKPSLTSPGEPEFVEVLAAYAIEKETGEGRNWRTIYDVNYRYVDQLILEELKA
jgi:hypothetical protein